METNQLELPYYYNNKKSSFYFSFLILPKNKREAIETIYAFCRYTDDIVDDFTNEQNKHMLLNKWKNELELCLKNKSEHPLLRKLFKVINDFSIPTKYFFELIDGMEMDLIKNRYKNFDELKTYCYKVASVVGLMCAEVFGYKNIQSKEYAINLGIALQITNILRDVKNDAERNRIYVPLEDMHSFNYSENELLQSKYNENFVKMMHYEYNRAIHYFNLAESQLNKEDRKNFKSAIIMGKIYLAILNKIKANNFNVLSNKTNISTTKKIFIALKDLLNN